MVSIRKTLVVVALLAAFASIAMAGVGDITPNCSATNNPILIRNEGVTELLSPVFVDCMLTNGNPTTLYTVVVTVLPGAYSNNIYVPITSAPKEAKVVSADIPFNITSVGADGFLNVASPTGVLNQIQFKHVNIDAPGTSLETRFSIAGLRIDASGLPATVNSAFLPAQNLDIQLVPETLDYSTNFFGNPSNTNTVVFNAAALASVSLSIAVSGGGTVIQCQPNTYSYTFSLAFKSAVFVNAFQQKNQFFMNDTLTGWDTNGTRLHGMISNVPSGVTLSVPLTLGSSPAGLTYYLLTGTDSHYAGGTAAASGALTVSGGTANFVYEIQPQAAPVPLANWTVSVPVAVTFPTSAIPALGAVGISATGTYAPLAATAAGAGASSSSAPLPRFQVGNVGVGDAGGNVVPCSTVLLYPYLTNEVGYDVGLAISNTSMDPFGTAGQAGTCAWYFYGDNAPAAAITTPSVAVGSTFTTLLSTLVPNAGLTYKGYAIVQCNFQFAHGYAFLVGKQISNWYAHGYLALVLRLPGAQKAKRATTNTNSPQFEQDTF